MKYKVKLKFFWFKKVKLSIFNIVNLLFFEGKLIFMILSKRFFFKRVGLRIFNLFVVFMINICKKLKWLIVRKCFVEKRNLNSK